ncbi:MAG: DUF2851 family protein [Bacteroidota bacterium]
MQKLSHINENQLHQIWINQSFNSKLNTLSGDSVTVLDPGTHNSDQAGPDFMNARIRIGNLVYVGDIEIDNDYNNWKSHGHNIDIKHNKVILHISLTNKSNHHYVYTKDGRKVPTVCLSKYLDRELISKIKSGKNEEKRFSKVNLKCTSTSSGVDFNTKKKYLADLGINRISHKSNRIYYRLKELTYLSELNIKEPVVKYDLHADFESKKFTHEDFKDKLIWQQLFYELLFEALGYTKNKAIMLHLAQAINIEYLSGLSLNGNFGLALESIMFNVSGLMPEIRNLPKEEVSDYTMDLFRYWEKIGDTYDGEKFNETDWHFFRTRPQNFPTIRIAGGVKYLEMILHDNMITTIIKKIEEIRNISVLIKSLRTLLVVRSRGFWKTHFVFDQPSKQEIKYFVGISRADEIIINVIIPFFMVYFDVFGNKALSKKVLSIYNSFDQKFSNKIIEEVAEGIETQELLKKSIYAQGMIELFRNYCSKDKCLECEIGKIVFT